MRRGFSILLILFFSLGPLAVALDADAESRLPACCRRHGQHHCAMSERAMLELAQRASDPTPAFSAPAHCPWFPGYLSQSVVPISGLAAAQHGLPAPRIQAHSPVVFDSSVRTQPIRPHSGRGPPDPLLG